MGTEEEFNFNKFWGDNELKKHVVFRRGSEMYCVYCGGLADTREHCPSKAFLSVPLPTDLPVVPACLKCNNGYSADERYAHALIHNLFQFYEKGEKCYEDIELDEKKEIRDAKINAAYFITNEKRIFDERLGRIFIKLAICHAAYELTEGFYCNEWDGEPVYVTYTIKSFLSEKDWNDLEYAENITGNAMPEMGSRIFRNIYVVQLPVVSLINGTEKLISLCMMDWTDIQDGFYKYIAYMQEDKLYVKMIFKEFLYAEVMFQKIS